MVQNSKTYNRKEISRILTKASKIQTAKDLSDDREGLTEEELIHVAEEVGISKETILEALNKIDEPDLKQQSYSFIKGTSRIQDVSVVKGEFSVDDWEDIVLEIRKITGGIGKINKTGKTYEWEQRKSDFGYRHFSFTPKNGQTKIQMVTSWGPFKMMAGFLSFFFTFVIALIVFKEISGKQIALMIAPFFGLGGFTLSRLFLKSYYRKQKDQLSSLTKAVTNKIKSLSSHTNHFEIEEEEVYDSYQKSNSKNSKSKNT